MVVNRLGVRRAYIVEHYLGLSTLIGSKKKEAFGNFCDKMRSKVSSWNNRFLSQGGKEVFIKAVLQNLPIYSMSCFLLPKTLCYELEQVMNQFWWQKSGVRKGMHWCCWLELSYSKDMGSMGFSDLCKFNITLLTKQGWCLIFNPDSLVARIFKAKYYPNTTFLKAQLGTYPSYRDLPILCLEEHLGSPETFGWWSRLACGIKGKHLHLGRLSKLLVLIGNQTERE